MSLLCPLVIRSGSGHVSCDNQVNPVNTSNSSHPTNPINSTSPTNPTNSITSKSQIKSHHEIESNHITNFHNKSTTPAKEVTLNHDNTRSARSPLHPRGEIAHFHCAQCRRQGDSHAPEHRASQSHLAPIRIFAARFFSLQPAAPRDALGHTT